MEFIQYLVTKTEFASGLAVCAFLLSVLSFCWTRKATQDSVKNNARIAEVDLEQKRYELLKSITEEYSLILDQVTSIGALKAEYDASHEVVKTLTESHTSLFSRTLPLLENYKAELENRHLGAVNWTVEKGVPELLKLMSEQDIALMNTKHAAKCHESCVSEFSQKLSMAQNYHKGAMR